MNKLYTAFLNALYPRKEYCILCGREEPTNICSSCANTVEFIHDRRCLKCGKGLKDSYRDNICPDCKERKFSFHSAYSSFLYKGSGKGIIHGLKYDGKKEGAKVLAKYMSHIIISEDLKGDAIVPVPIHEGKMALRGFNQSYLIGEHLSRYISLPLWPCLTRTKDTKDQFNLDRHERKFNVINAFSFELLYNIKNKRILLIDDVFTTGSTADECSKVLLSSGAKDVFVVTAASGTNI